MASRNFGSYVTSTSRCAFEPFPQPLSCATTRPPNRQQAYLLYVWVLLFCCCSAAAERHPGRAAAVASKVINRAGYHTHGCTSRVWRVVSEVLIVTTRYKGNGQIKAQQQASQR
jgi:hypothetical protein